MTVTGKTVGQNLKRKIDTDPKVIKTFKNSLEDNAGFLVMKSNLYIGSWSSTRDFNGSIDEVMIFNRSLSTSEISALYNSSANKYYNNFSGLASGSHSFKVLFFWSWAAFV